MTNKDRDAGLRATTARGFAFEAGKTVVLMFISTAKIAVIARLLQPDAFGLFGLALAFLAGLETLTQVGADRYVIQKKHADAGLIGCAWCLRYCVAPSFA